MNPLHMNVFFRNYHRRRRTATYLARTINGKDFVCPHCQNEGFNAIKTRPEVRTCKACRKQTRLRSGTLFQSSKTPLLIWVKAIFHVMNSKRGISALELQRHLGLKSYGLTWTMLQKIREALKQRDEDYQVGDGVIEIDGAVFGKKASNNQAEALIDIAHKKTGLMKKEKKKVVQVLPRY